MESEKIHYLCDLLDIDTDKLKVPKIDTENICLSIFMFIFIMIIFILTICYLV